MVSTAILTAISDLLGLFATVRTHPDSLTGKEFRTSVNFSGRAADDWGSRGREFKSRQPDRKAPSEAHFRVKPASGIPDRVAMGVAITI